MPESSPDGGIAMATLLDQPSIQPPAIERATSSAPARRARRSLDERTDREVGLVAVGVVAGLALLVVTLLIAVLIYSTTWGYAIEL
jgi:hypothetical protein